MARVHVHSLYAILGSLLRNRFVSLLWILTDT